MNELEKLRRTVEMTERVRDGYRNNLLEHVAYSVSLFQPRELTNSERYMLAMAERQVIEAKLAYREAYLRWRVLADCSKVARDPVRDR